MKDALLPSRASGLYSHTAKAYYNTDSVVYNGSTFSQKIQEYEKNTILSFKLLLSTEGDDESAYLCLLPFIF